MLYLRVPLPDLVGIARRITALPADHRSSTYAVLGLLKREGIEQPQLRRDIDAVLSWLPLVNTAPPEDFEANMRDQFSPALWNTMSNEEKESLSKLRRILPEFAAWVGLGGRRNLSTQ